MAAKKRKRPAKVAKLRNMLTLTEKQSKFVRALIEQRTHRQAALIAGYSPKNIDQSANQAYNSILIKAPEAMGRAGLPLDVVISKHLVPLLHATEVKFAQTEGTFTDAVEVEALPTRLGATRLACELLNAVGYRDPMIQNNTFSVVQIDIPWSGGKPLTTDTKTVEVVHAPLPPAKKIPAKT